MMRDFISEIPVLSPGCLFGCRASGSIDPAGKLTRALAAAFFLAVTVLMGDDAVDSFNFAEGLFIHGDYVSAAEEFESFVKKFPDSEHAATARFRIGECYMRSGDDEQAAAAFENALGKFPDSDPAPLGYYNLARTFVGMKDPDRALSAFRGALERGGGEIREQAFIGAGECLIELGKLEEAVDNYSSFLKEFPKSEHRAEAMFSRGWSELRLSRHADAAKTFRVLIEHYPDLRDVDKSRLALSDAYSALGQYSESTAVLEECSSNGGMAEKVLLRQAWNLFKSGKKPAAAKAFASFAETFPKSSLAASALYNAGIACFDTAEFEQAVSHLERVFTRFADSVEAADARYWCALSHFNAGSFDKSIAVMKPLLSDPDSGKDGRSETLRCIQARAEAKLGKHTQAIRLFRKFLREYPDSEYSGRISYSLAHSLAESGDFKEAVSVLEALLKDLPAGELRADSLFAVGEYLYRLGESERSLAYLLELLETRPAAPDLIYRLSWVYFDIGTYRKSLDLFSRLSGMESNFSDEALFMCGRCSEKLALTDQAIGYYRELVTGKADDQFLEKGYYRLGFLLGPKQAVENLEDCESRLNAPKHLVEMKLKAAEGFFDAGDIAKAAKYYREVLDDQDARGRAAAANYGMGWCMLRQDNPGEADRYFAEVMTADDASEEISSDAALQRGEIAYDREEHSKARDFFAMVSSDEKGGERAHYMLGWCTRKLEKPKESAEWFRECVEKYPEGEFFFDSALRLGETLNTEGRHPEVRKLLEPILNRKKTEIDVREDLLHEYCEALVALEDWQELLTRCSELKQRFPESKRLYFASFRTGLAYQALELFDKAEGAFRETIAATDSIEAARAQFNIGSMCFAREQFVDAAKNFLRVEMLYDYESLTPRALFHAVESFVRAGETDRADMYRRRLLDRYADSKWGIRAREKMKEKP